MVGSNIFDAVVEAIKEPLPEFDTIEAEAIAAPMRGARDLATLETMFDLSHRFIQCGTVGNRLGLTTGPGRDLAASWSSGKIRIGILI